MSGFTPARVAIVHDYLNQRGGAERVVLELAAMWPEATIYTSLYRPDSTFEEFKHLNIRTSPLDAIPVDRGFRRLFPLYPAAFRMLGVIDADLVMSSSAGWAHHVRTSPTAFHAVYCHTPPRWLWTDEYGGDPGGEALIGPFKPFLRRWDARRAQRQDEYIAGSRVAQERIRTAYRREAPIVHPPVDVGRLTPTREGDGLLVVSRLLPYKRIDLVVDAARELGIRLDIVGSGPALPALRERAGHLIRFHGSVDDATLVELYQGCSALCMPGHEDFGIVPVEAMAAGKPVIAFGAGGALETVDDGSTGVLFDRQDVPSLSEAIRRCDALPREPERLAASAARFSPAAFRSRLLATLSVLRARSAA